MSDINIIKTSYDNTKVLGTSSDVTARSQIPIDINTPTLLQLNAVLRANQNNKIGISSQLKNYITAQELQVSGSMIDAALSNYKPEVLTGNVIQRNSGTSAQLNNRSAVLAGVDSKVQEIANQLNTMADLSEQRAALVSQLDEYTNQLNALTKKLLGLANTQHSVEELEKIEVEIAEVEMAYNTANEKYEKINKAWNDRYNAWEKLTINYVKTRDKAYNDIHELHVKVDKFIDAPLSLSFPRKPNLPKLSLKKVDIAQTVSNLVSAIKASGRQAAKNSLNQADKENQMIINTGKDQDAFQKMASSAGAAVRQARQQVQVTQAAQAAAAQAAITPLRNSITTLKKQAAVAEDNLYKSATSVTAQVRSAVSTGISQAATIQNNIQNVATNVQNTVSNTQNTINSVTSKLG
jgi:hypothetical protein